MSASSERKGWWTAREPTYPTRRLEPGKFTLHREIPLHHVVPGRMRFEVSLAKSVRRCGECCVGRHRVGSRRQVSCARGFEERRRKEFVHLEQIRQRQYVEDPETSTHRGLAIAHGVPGKAHARLQIAKRRVRSQR